MKKQPFNGKILMLGCGGVAQCLVPLLARHIAMPACNITILEQADNRARVQELLNAGAHYVQGKITPDNLAGTLATYVGAGDMIIDLAYDIGCIDILQWCHDNHVLYVNASIELWDPYYNARNTPPTERTLYARHMALRNHIASWKKQGATAVLDHGANPGFVYHFVKVGLEDIARALLAQHPNRERTLSLETALANKDYARLAQATGVKVIHISERDTQITNNPKQVNEFVNTWSIDGLYEEGVAPAELGWGTHERTLPHDAHTHAQGPRNQICLAQSGMNTRVRSWVPSGEIIGMVIRHGEAFTISDKLTVMHDGQALYRPTVHYAYCPSDSTINSLLECQMRQFDLQKKKRVLADEIIDGHDELGLLLMGHDFKSWWIGSILDIHETRQLTPGQNATTLQVAASVLAAIIWMINNPNKGVNVPGDLPHDELLPLMIPYLGKVISTPVNWTPLMNRFDRELFGNYNPLFKEIPPEDTWQFSSFRIS